MSALFSSIYSTAIPWALWLVYNKGAGGSLQQATTMCYHSKILENVYVVAPYQAFANLIAISTQKPSWHIINGTLEITNPQPGFEPWSPRTESQCATKELCWPFNKITFCLKGVPRNFKTLCKLPWTFCKAPCSENNFQHSSLSYRLLFLKRAYIFCVMYRRGGKIISWKQSTRPGAWKWVGVQNRFFLRDAIFEWSLFKNNKLKEPNPCKA